jgi:hypothetical protein
MSEPIVAVSDSQFSFCVVCQEPGRVGRLKVKGWPHAPLVCASCLRSIATTIELDGTAAASVAENRHE